MTYEPAIAYALREDIAMWEHNANITHPDEVQIGIDKSSLCGMFIADNCAGCPVMERTKELFCKDTPAARAYSEVHLWHRYPAKALHEKNYRIYAEAHVSFLQHIYADQWQDKWWKPKEHPINKFEEAPIFSLFMIIGYSAVALLVGIALVVKLGLGS